MFEHMQVIYKNYYLTYLTSYTYEHISLLLGLAFVWLLLTIDGASKSVDHLSYGNLHTMGLLGQPGQEHQEL
jgi:hypothetical protein